MKIFDVYVTRETTESFIMTVEAENEYDAVNQADEDIRSLSEKEIDDTYGPFIEANSNGWKVEEAWESS